MNRVDQILDMLQNEPSDPFLHYALALEFMKEKRMEEARKHFLYLIEDHPSYLATYYQYGLFLENLGKENEALVIYKKGSELAKNQGDLKTKAELDEAIWELE